MCKLCYETVITSNCCSLHCTLVIANLAPSLCVTISLLDLVCICQWLLRPDPV